eukprot:1917279-Prymnesium_polylepis.1
MRADAARESRPKARRRVTKARMEVLHIWAALGPAEFDAHPVASLARRARGALGARETGARRVPSESGERAGRPHEWDL